MLTGRNGAVRAVVVTKGNELVSVGEDETLQTWDLERKEKAYTLDGNAASIHSVLLDANGRTIITVAANNSIESWDPVVGRHLYTLQVPGMSRSQAAAITPDGERLYTAHGNRVVVWRTGPVDTRRHNK